MPAFQRVFFFSNFLNHAFSYKAKKLQKTCSLTPREYEILCMIYAYRDNTEISQSLGITDSTLQKHLQNIFRKTKTSSRWELLRLQLPGEGSAASGDL